MKRVFGAWFVALAFLVAFAPSAGAAQSTTAEYVNGVCTSINSFRDTIDAASQTFQENAAPLTTAKSVKTEFVAFFDELHDAVVTLQADLKAVGHPAMKNGSKIAQELRAGIDDMEEAVAAAGKTAAKLKTSSPARFGRDADALGKKLDKAFSVIGDAFDDIEYDTSALEAARDADADCAALDSSSS